jgi:hypothetical protein
MDKSGAGAGFLRELRFPLPNYIPSLINTGFLDFVHRPEFYN